MLWLHKHCLCVSVCVCVCIYVNSLRNVFKFCITISLFFLKPFELFFSQFFYLPYFNFFPKEKKTLNLWNNLVNTAHMWGKCRFWDNKRWFSVDFVSNISHKLVFKLIYCSVSHSYVLRICMNSRRHCETLKYYGWVASCPKTVICLIIVSQISLQLATMIGIRLFVWYIEALSITLS